MTETINNGNNLISLSEGEKKPYLLIIKLGKLSGFDIPVQSKVKKISAFVQFHSKQFNPQDCALYHGSEPFLCVEGPEEAFWKAGCTRQRLNDEAYFELNLEEGETVKFDISVGFMFWHAKDGSDGEEVIDKDQLYIVGKGSFETVGALVGTSSNEATIPLEALKEVQIISKKASNVPKNIIKATKYTQDFSLQLNVQLNSRSLELEIDDEMNHA